MNFLKNKKFQYGSVAVALTAIVIALVLVVNVTVSLLSSHFGWYADISMSGLFRFSESSLAMMDALDKENNKITVYFFSDENTLTSTPYGGYVLGLVTELENRYADEGFVTVEYIEDINKDLFEIGAIFGEKPEYAQDLVDRMDPDNTVKTLGIDTIVIRNDTYVMGENGEFVTDVRGEKTEDYRLSVFSIIDLYSEAGYSFLGDYMLTSRLVSICHLSPTAYFLTGHDEMTVEEDGTYGNAEYLAGVLETCGFTLDKINLAQDDFGETVVEPSVAVIFAPRVDYTKVELERLKSFVGGGGHLLFFADGVHRELANLNAFLEEYGISIASAKFKSGMDASLGNNDFSFAARVNETSGVIKSITDLSGKAAISDCRVLRIDESKGAEAILLAPESATLNGSDTTVLGNEAVAALSQGENRGSVFATGAASLASSLVYNPSYFNRDVLLSLLQEMGAERVPLNLEIKTLASDGLDLTRSQAVIMTVLVSAVPALIFAALGIVIYVRRKRS